MMVDSTNIEPVLVDWITLFAAKTIGRNIVAAGTNKARCPRSQPEHGLKRSQVPSGHAPHFPRCTAPRVGCLVNPTSLPYSESSTVQHMTEVGTLVGTVLPPFYQLPVPSSQRNHKASIANGCSAQFHPRCRRRKQSSCPNSRATSP